MFEDGELCGAVVVFRDISRAQGNRAPTAKRPYDELVSVKNEQQLILDAAGEGIYGINADGKMTFGNAGDRGDSRLEN